MPKLTCTMCSEVEEVPATEEQIRNWKNGMLIQKAMPNLTAAQRELFISRTCGSCFDKLFEGDEDDE